MDKKFFVYRCEECGKELACELKAYTPSGYSGEPVDCPYEDCNHPVWFEVKDGE